jgi:hypothetical protein
VSHNAIFLGDGQIDQLIVRVHPDKIQALLEFGVKASTKAVTLLGVGVHMVSSVQAQAVEGLGVLDDRAGALGEG